MIMGYNSICVLQLYISSPVCVLSLYFTYQVNEIMYLHTGKSLFPNCVANGSRQSRCPLRGEQVPCELVSTLLHASWHTTVPVIVSCRQNSFIHWTRGKSTWRSINLSFRASLTLKPESIKSRQDLWNILGGRESQALRGSISMKSFLVNCLKVNNYK